LIIPYLFDPDNEIAASIPRTSFSPAARG